MFNDLHIIGATAEVKFIGLNDNFVPARIDTGAQTSALWASDIKVNGDNISFTLFGKTSPYYDGQRITLPLQATKNIRSTNGSVEERYVIKLPVLINGRKIRASFTLADRKTQIYPILVGRNILRGKFAVDIKHPIKTEGQK